MVERARPLGLSTGHAPCRGSEEHPPVPTPLRGAGHGRSDRGPLEPIS